MKDSAVIRLAENVWQVDFQQSPTAFARLVSGFAQHHLEYMEFYRLSSRLNGCRSVSIPE
jgi:hypothetical protein